jgi:outer membrane protein assembly factor BamA
LNSLNARDFITAQREKRVGGAIGLSYGLNKFQRIDGQFVMRHIDRSTDLFYTTLEGDKSFTSSVFLTYVNDNALWTIGGPATGQRYYVTVGQTVDYLGRGFNSTNLFADYRKYFKVARRTVIALRYQMRSKFGGDAARVYYLGGPWSLRGYRYREFFGRTTQLVNSEIRFPALDGLKLALPFGDIELPSFRGALFFDVGSASRNGAAASVLDSGWLGSFGAGVELNLGYAPVIRVNFTQRTDFDTISPDKRWELFIGYNY